MLNEFCAFSGNLTVHETVFADFSDFNRFSFAKGFCAADDF